MATQVLTAEEVSTFLRDRVENNHLLDTVEFPPTIINLAIELAISEFNSIPPMSQHNLLDFPSKSILLSGTLYKMFSGQCALMARNHMEYSDGGLTIPVEERFQLYTALAGMYQSDFQNSARAIKTQMNLDSGWGGVSSAYGYLPIW